MTVFEPVSLPRIAALGAVLAGFAGAASVQITVQQMALGRVRA